jgi:hypothetical protein
VLGFLRHSTCAGTVCTLGDGTRVRSPLVVALSAACPDAFPPVCFVGFFSLFLSLDDEGGLTDCERDAGPPPLLSGWLFGVR